MWTFLTIICLAGMIQSYFQSRMKHQEKMRQQPDSGGADSEERFRRLERRLANLETIVIERDKKSEFEQALK